MESKRIKLERPFLEIAPKIFEAIMESQNELAEYLPWVPNALTMEAAVTNTKNAIDNFDTFSGELRYSIICKRSDTFLGVIGLMIKDKSIPYFEIGYWLRSSQVGNGYMTEAIHLIEKHAFGDLGARRLELTMAESNLKSQAIAKRCGYQYEGLLQNGRRLPSGELDNTVIYAKTGL